MSLFDEDDLTPSGAPQGPSTRVRMTVAYDGGPYKGFARQPGVKTVAGTLEEAIERVLRVPVRLTCAGRTDAGVHAWGQVVHFDVPDPLGGDRVLDLDALQRSLNRMLRTTIAVRAVDVAPEGFDARHSAVARHYRYTVMNRPVPDPFLAATSWHVESPLDLRAMQLACDPFFGEHDFAAFCKKPDDPQASTVRKVLDARWLDLGDGLLRFDISATSFCHNMVRSIVGTLVDVGLERKTAGDMAWIIRTGDRQHAGPVAPAHGLLLWAVRY
ncbi:MAG TPA: tRNA pseudouridine(38-40) synthase TruA [Acidimicrobiales bacterium]|nr:tRNA pseudouridine(38-40) synthase TruA [Acidimicrobiales bacterium]